MFSCRVRQLRHPCFDCLADISGRSYAAALKIDVLNPCLGSNRIGSSATTTRNTSVTRSAFKLLIFKNIRTSSDIRQTLIDTNFVSITLDSFVNVTSSKRHDNVCHGRVIGKGNVSTYCLNAAPVC